MKKITRTIKEYHYTLFAINMVAGVPQMEEVEKGIYFDEMPKEQEIVKEYRVNTQETRTLVVVLDDVKEVKYSLSVTAFCRYASMENMTNDTIYGVPECGIE